MSDLPTSPRAPQSSSSVASRDWLTLHAKKIAVAAIAIAATVGGIYAYRQVSASTAQRAERAYFAAQATQGAAADQERALDGVVGAYRGTPAATQAAMLLTQLRYNRGAYAEGVATLPASTGRPASRGVDRRAHRGRARGPGSVRRGAAKYREAARGGAIRGRSRRLPSGCGARVSGAGKRRGGSAHLDRPRRRPLGVRRRGARRLASDGEAGRPELSATPPAAHAPLASRVHRTAAASDGLARFSVFGPHAAPGDRMRLRAAAVPRSSADSGHGSAGAKQLRIICGYVN